jgi:methylenetetrahydrofolate dehydrogenase (NADP+) / methenyltetrahydrofolate cyclohydrolase
MSARIIDGKAFAARLTARVAAEAAKLKREHGITPGIAVVLVGDDPASAMYALRKAGRCRTQA